LEDDFEYVQVPAYQLAPGCIHIEKG